jgi:hypothetical protein
VGNLFDDIKRRMVKVGWTMDVRGFELVAAMVVLDEEAMV